MYRVNEIIHTSVGSWADPGILDYKSLHLRNSTCSPLIESKTSGTYCHDSLLNRIVVYDSVTAVQKKVEYVKKYGLAGVMFWEASADIYTDPRDGLIAAAKASLAPFTIDRMANNLCYPNSKYANVNSLLNCKSKTAPNVGNFTPIPFLSPVNMESIRKAVPFGSKIHKK